VINTIAIINRLKPTGGVICDISTTSARKIPNQIGLIPDCVTMGKTTDVVSTMTEIPSRKQPKAMKKMVRHKINWMADSPNVAIHSASTLGMPTFFKGL